MTIFDEHLESNIVNIAQFLSDMHVCSSLLCAIDKKISETK